MAAVRAIDYSSASFKINVALSELPDFAVGAAGVALAALALLAVPRARPARAQPANQAGALETAASAA